MEKTLCIIKPDAVQSGVIGKILEQLEAHELKIIDLKMGQWPLTTWENFYAEHDGRPYFGRLTSFMCSGPVVIVALEGPNAITDYRRLMGTTDPKSSPLGTLRRQFGTEIPANAVHGSDSPESAKRELHYWFEDFEKYHGS